MQRMSITREIGKIKNLHEEKEKFFASKTYNPQFEYETPVEQSRLTFYGIPNRHMFEYSKYIIDKALIDYGSFHEMPEIEGYLLNLEQAKEDFDEYLEDNKVADKVEIQYLDTLIPRTNTTLTDNNEIILKIRLPIAYRNKSMQAVLDHEIGTHVFRWINDMRQPWYDNALREDFSDHLLTEEGLATLHWLLTHPVNIPFQQAIYYYVVFLGQYVGFRELYEKLYDLFRDREYAWFLALRVKRGYEDTEQPGAYTKDIVYLEGVKQVAAWLAYNEYNADQLYLGKIALIDVDRVHKIDGYHEPLLPQLVRDESYSDRIAKVIRDNEFLSL